MFKRSLNKAHSGAQHQRIGMSMIGATRSVHLDSQYDYWTSLLPVGFIRDTKRMG